jgi:uncharacterized protein YkwD
MAERTAKKYFIPCIDNEYKPHFFRERSVAYLATIIIGLFLITSALQYSISINSSLFATVVSAVLVDLANADREGMSVHPLVLNSTLIEAAQLKANDMASKGYFAHTSPEGITPWFWFEATGYRFSYAGENLAINFSDSEDVERAWMNSEGHRANILNGNFTEIGIATANGTYQGRETTFVVQLFGKPARALASTAETAPSVSEKPVVSKKEDGAALPLKEEQKELETVTEDEMFVAVKDISNAEPKAATITEEGAVKTPVYASFIGRVVSSPSNLLGSLYLLLGIIITIALLLMVFIEIRRQHPLHIAYALSLLVLIVGLYALQAALFPSVIVI